jgi:hypothetical protein
VTRCLWDHCKVTAQISGTRAKENTTGTPVYRQNDRKSSGNKCQFHSSPTGLEGTIPQSLAQRMNQDLSEFGTTEPQTGPTPCFCQNVLLMAKLSPSERTDKLNLPLVTLVAVGTWNTLHATAHGADMASSNSSELPTKPVHWNYELLK